MGRTTLITHPVSEQTKRFGSQYNRQVWTFVWGLLDNFPIALIEESPPKVRCADSSAIRLILISDSIRFSSVFDFREMGNSKKTHATFSGVIFQSQDFRTLVSIHYILSMAHIINILLCHLARVLHSSVRIPLTWQHAYRTHSHTHRVLQYIFTLDSNLPAATCYYSPEDYYVCQRPAAMRIDTPAFSAFV